MNGSTIDIFIRESLIEQKGYKEAKGVGKIVDQCVSRGLGEPGEYKRFIEIIDGGGLLYPKMYIAAPSLNMTINNLKMPLHYGYGFKATSPVFSPSTCFHMVCLSKEELEENWKKVFTEIRNGYLGLAEWYRMKGEVRE